LTVVGNIPAVQPEIPYSQGLCPVQEPSGGTYGDTAPWLRATNTDARPGHVVRAGRSATR